MIPLLAVSCAISPIDAVNCEPENDPVNSNLVVASAHLRFVDEPKFPLLLNWSSVLLPAGEVVAPVAVKS